MAYKNKVFLFTGDIESEVERSLIAECPEKLKCDVLKIPHHGSITSSTQEFVKKTNADYGVITTYAFNDFDVLNRYTENKTRTLITSINGTVMFLTDGNNLQYATDRQ